MRKYVTPAEFAEECFNFLQIDPNVHSYEQAHKRFRDLAKYHHPDKGGREEHFKLINTAWQVVSKELKKGD